MYIIRRREASAQIFAVCKPSHEVTTKGVNMTSRLCLVLLLYSTLLNAGESPTSEDGNPRPNFVFILLDDVRFDDLGFTGHPFVQTPNLDRIAHEGMQFSNSFAATPLCSPNRASILTGQYAHTHGITDNVDRSAQSHALITFPLLLNEAGYKTAFIGKWHMGIDDSRRPGFDEWLSIKGQGFYFDPEVNDNGTETRLKGYATDVFSNRAAQFIRHAGGQPFLLYLSHKAVHPNIFQNADGSIDEIPPDGGFTPPNRLENLYQGEEISRRPNASSYARGKPALEREIAGLPPLGPDTATPDHVILNRLRMLTAADQGFGWILQALEDTGQMDNSVIIVTSDHGYFYGEHGLNEERRLAYEETARTPLAVRYPPLVKAESTASQFVLSIDLAPTFLELAGVPIPDWMQGRSLVTLLRGDPAPNWRQSILIEYFSDTVWPRLVKMGYQAVRTSDWKYIHYVDIDGMDELYNLQEDPYEIDNLISAPADQDELDRLKTELQKLLTDTDAKS